MTKKSVWEQGILHCDVVIQMFYLPLKIFFKLWPLGFQCGGQQSIFYGEHLIMNVDVFNLEMEEHYEVFKYFSSVFTNNLLPDYEMWSILRQHFNHVLTCSNEWRPPALPKHNMSSIMAFFRSFITGKIQSLVIFQWAKMLHK